MAANNSSNISFSNAKENADGLLKPAIKAFEKDESTISHEMTQKLNDTIKFAEEEYSFLSQQLSKFAKKSYITMKRNPALTLLGVAAVGFMAAKAIQSYSRGRSSHVTK